MTVAKDLLSLESVSNSNRGRCGNTQSRGAVDSVWHNNSDPGLESEKQQQQHDMIDPAAYYKQTKTDFWLIKNKKQMKIVNITIKAHLTAVLELLFIIIWFLSRWSWHSCWRTCRWKYLSRGSFFTIVGQQHLQKKNMERDQKVALCRNNTQCILKGQFKQKSESAPVVLIHLSRLFLCEFKGFGDIHTVLQSVKN